MKPLVFGASCTFRNVETLSVTATASCMNIVLMQHASSYLKTSHARPVWRSKFIKTSTEIHSHQDKNLLKKLFYILLLGIKGNIRAAGQRFVTRTAVWTAKILIHSEAMNTVNLCNSDLVLPVLKSTSHYWEQCTITVITTSAAG